METQNLYLKICECPNGDAACWAGMADMVQPGGGELFFVPDDEDDLQDNVAVGGLGEG